MMSDVMRQVIEVARGFTARAGGCRHGWVLVMVLLLLTVLPGGVAWAETVEQRLHEARQLYVDGAYAEAAEAFAAIVADRPEVAEAHLFRGHAAFALERFDEARSAYARAIEAGRLDAALLGRLAQIEQRAERRGSALSALRLLVLVTPGDHDLHLAVAEACAAAGLDGEAEQLYQQVIRVRPSDASAHLRLANLHLRRDRWRDAIGPMTLAYHLDEADVQRARTLGDLHMRAEQPDTAVAWYERAIEGGMTGGEVHLRLAQGWLAKDDRDAARAAAERAAETAASEGDERTAGRALLLLGQLAREVGELDAAVSYWQRAAAVEGVPSQVYVYLGTHAYENERFDDAAKHFAAARSAGDTEAGTLRLLVLSYVRQGAVAEARAALLSYIERYGLDDTAEALVQRVARER